MNIPDPFIYASIAPIGGFVVWTGRQFVVWATNQKKNQEVDSTLQPLVELTVRDYKQITELFTKELNGRYMFATEAREKFEKLEQQLASHATEMRVFMAKIGKDKQQ